MFVTTRCHCRAGQDTSRCCWRCACLSQHAVTAAMVTTHARRAYGSSAPASHHPVCHIPWRRLVRREPKSRCLGGVRGWNSCGLILLTKNLWFTRAFVAPNNEEMPASLQSPFCMAIQARSSQHAKAESSGMSEVVKLLFGALSCEYEWLARVLAAMTASLCI